LGHIRSLNRVTLIAALLASVTLVTITSRTEGAFANTIARCQETQLDVKITSDGAAAGHVGDLIVISNVGASACTVTGYARVSMSGGANVVSTVAKRRRTDTWVDWADRHDDVNSAVTLRAHGGAASSIVEGGTFPSGTPSSGVTYTKVSVALPLLNPPYRFTTKFPGCIRPEVHPSSGFKGIAVQVGPP